MSTLYLKGIEVALDALFNETSAPSGTPKASWMKTTYTPNAGTHQFYSDISSDVATNTSAQTLANVDIQIDSGNVRVEMDADNISQSSITTTTDKVVVWIDTGTPSTSPLVCCVDIAEGTLTAVSGTITTSFNAEGIFALNAS